MSAIDKVKTGDIFEFVKPRISKIGPRCFNDSFTGNPVTTHAFSIKGIQGSHPFANGLVKKRFVALVENQKEGLSAEEFIWRNSKNIYLFMLDNYKPEILGVGYQLTVLSSRYKLECLKKTDTILSIKDLPHAAKAFFYRDTISTEYTRNKINKTSKTITDKISLFRKNLLMLTGVPKKIQVALLSVQQRRCTCCSSHLMSLRTSLIDLDITEKKNEIAKELSSYLIRNMGLQKRHTVYVMPVVYLCNECGTYNFLVNVYYGTEEVNMEKLLNINLNLGERIALEKANIKWQEEI